MSQRRARRRKKNRATPIATHRVGYEHVSRYFAARPLSPLLSHVRTARNQMAGATGSASSSMRSLAWNHGSEALPGAVCARWLLRALSIPSEVTGNSFAGCRPVWELHRYDRARESHSALSEIHPSCQWRVPLFAGQQDLHSGTQPWTKSPHA